MEYLSDSISSADLQQQANIYANYNYQRLLLDLEKILSITPLSHTVSLEKRMIDCNVYNWMIWNCSLPCLKKKKS